jgi:hypothetical protein
MTREPELSGHPAKSDCSHKDRRSSGQPDV